MNQFTKPIFLANLVDDIREPFGRSRIYIYPFNQILDINRNSYTAFSNV